MRKNITLLILLFLFTACKKQDEFLDKKSNKADVIPATLADFQALLDNDRVLNEKMPCLGTIGSDNINVLFADWQSAGSSQERNAFVWNSQIYSGEPGIDWLYAYQQITQANVVLEGLPRALPTVATQTQWNSLRGGALVHRAIAYYNLLQQFAKTYERSTAAADPGIVLKSSADVNEPAMRSSVQECYDKLISDLREAELLLPVTSLIKTRPSKTTAQSMLAKAYLMTENYAEAEKYATLALAANNSLVDFNTLNAAPYPNLPFPTFDKTNPEIIFYSETSSISLLSYKTLIVDDGLYQSYSANDLRRTIFYDNNGMNAVYFKGTYTGTATNFSGLATNELILIRSEAAARLGEKENALADLNRLLIKRWKTGTYVPFSTATAEEALTLILRERRKELPFTANTRWEDLRRLNKDARFAKTLIRTLNGQYYTLVPNDRKYVLPLPDDEIRLSGISQNER